MGIFSGLKTKLASVSLGIFGVTSTHEPTSAEEVADVFTCLKILTETVSKLTPQAYNSDNRIEKGHRLNSVLGRRPNLFQNHQAFWQTVEYVRNIYGNSYVYVQRDSQGYATKLYALSNESISKIFLDSSGHLWYDIDFNLTVACPKKTSGLIKGENILHFKHQSKDGIFGISPLTALKTYASILSRASKMLDSFYGNNAMSTLALKPKLDKASMAKTMADAAEEFTNKHGSNQSGKIITIPPNTDLVEVNQKYSDAQVLETQRYGKEQIGSMFGIPKFMLGITDTDLSIEQQTKQFSAFGISPILAMYSAEMEFKLIRDDEYEKGIYIGYDIDKLIETDTKTKVETTSLQVSKGLMTPDEGATRLGNKPVGGTFGKLHWIQSQNNPIEYYDQWGKTNNNNNSNNKEPDGEISQDKLNADNGNEKP